MTPPFVKRYLVAFDRYKWVGLTGFTAVVGVAGIVAFNQPDPPPPNYVAQGTLAYKSPPVTFSAIGTQIQQEGQALSKDLLLAGNLIQETAAMVSTDPKLIRDQTEVQFPEPDESNLIKVQYLDVDPPRAIAVVESLMKGMVEQSRLINTARVRAIIQSINERLPEVTNELREAEQSLEDYDRKEGATLSAAQNGSLIGGITASQDQQRQTQLALEGIEAQMRSLEQRLGLSANQAYVSSALSSDPIIANLRAQLYQLESQMTVLSRDPSAYNNDLVMNNLRGQIRQTESQLAILTRDLRPQHPRVIELQNQLQSYQQLLQQRISESMAELRSQQQSYRQLLQDRAGEVVGGNGLVPLGSDRQIRRESSLDPARQGLANALVNLSTQRETLQQQLRTLRRTEQELRSEYANFPNKQMERARLEQQVLLKKAFYDQMQAKLVDARAAEAETVSSLSIAKPPEIIEATEPTQIASNPYITLGVGGLVGLLVGGGIIFLLGTLEGKFYTLEDVRGALRQQDVPLLGILPLIQLLDLEGNDVPILIEPDSLYLEFYERFRSNLMRAGDRNLKVVVLTSTVAQEGKTVSAYNLAIASARAGKRTLLIEADLRSPSQARSVRVSPDPDSVVEPLRYYGQLSDCIRLVPAVENLYIVPSPGPQQHAAAILESSEMRRLLDDVRGRFDLVILDMPALSRCNDALILEPYSDGIVLITRPGYTEDSLFSEAVEQLTESDDIMLLGAVINGTDIAVPLPEDDANLEAQLRAEELEANQNLEEVPTGIRHF